MKTYLRKTLQAFILLLMAVPISANSATTPNKFAIHLTDPTMRIVFPGASFLPPGEDWYTAYKQKNKVIFTKALLKKPNTQPLALHTIAAEATTDFVDAVLNDRNEIIDHIKNELEKEKMEEGFRSIELKISLDKSEGYDCMRYERKVEDRSAPQFEGGAFILDVHNLTCPHPDYPRYIIKLTYSQRYRAGSRPIPIDIEGELFLKSLRLENLKRPFVAVEIPVGKGPQGVAVGHNAVWVAAAEDNTVFRIDPHTNKVIKTIAVGENPVGVAVNDNAVWVSNKGEGTVSRIDPALNKVVATIEVGRSPLFLSAGEDSIWVANSVPTFFDYTVSRINPRTNKVIATIKVGRQPTDVAIDRGAVWVANSKSNTVSRIDPKTNIVVSTIRVGSGAKSILIDKGAVWLSNQKDGTLSRIDPDTNKVVATFQVGHDPSDLAAGDGHIWVVNMSDNTIYNIDSNTNQVIGKPIPVGARPFSIAFGEGAVWVTNVDDGTIMRIEP